ncbi:MAG: ATP-binding protein [Christensenellaceae bacterium]
MIKLFEVSGFKNFKDKFILDFSNVRDYKFNTDCVSGELLKNIIIYGQNSVGKTNLGLALFDIVSHLTSKNVTPGLYDYYLNVENHNHLADFHYIFQFGNDLIDYTYSKDSKQKLTKEKLLLNETLILDQDYVKKTGSLDGIIALSPTLNWAFRDDDSLLKYALNNTSLPDEHPLYKMMQFVSSMLWFRTLDENRYIGNKAKSDDFTDFIFDKDTRKEFEALLHKTGITENLTVKTGPDDKKRLYFDTPTPLPFLTVASSGTKALYTFFYWYKTAQNASFMYIDEFDAYYHYELSEAIVMILEKMKNTQVILTSHNTNLLTNRIMRPDCYFILTKDKLTSLADATPRELREGHNLEKLYMSGEFDGL